MHFNANAGRQQAATEDGDLRWTIVRPKACKGAPVAKILKEKPTRGIYYQFLYCQFPATVVSGKNARS